MTGLVLSIFPGIDLLGRAFEEEGYCIVCGPDLIRGGDIRRSRWPAGRFDGVIGGPSCQRWSRLANIVRAVHGEASLAPDMIPEFVRCVDEAQPAWFLMENVPGAPLPAPKGYQVGSWVLNNRWFGGEQNRERRISFGRKGAPANLLPHLKVETFEAQKWEPAVTGSAGGRRASVKVGGSGKRKQASLLTRRSIADECELQGLPRDFLDDCPLTADGKRLAVGNGVPLPMGRAIARAVKAAAAP